MEPPVIFFNSIIIIITIMVIFLPVIVKSIARRFGKYKQKEVQKQPEEAALQLSKDEEIIPEEPIQTQLTESGEWLREEKIGARTRIDRLPPLKRAVLWSEILKRPDVFKGPGLY